MALPSIPRLHLITDTRPGRDALAVVRAALTGYRLVSAEVASAVGSPVVQVRVEDSATDRDAYDLAVRIVGLCAQSGATCLINDRLHIAVAVGAAGGHVGALDLPVTAARRVLGPAAILGATARTADSARAAVAAGASYLGVGPCFSTSTKECLPAPLGLLGLAAVAAAVPVPVIAIAGVTAARVPALMTAGAHGVAVVGAVSTAADPARATAALVTALALAPTGDAPAVAGAPEARP